MASSFIVCLILVSYSAAAVILDSVAAHASPASITAATPRLDRFGDAAATSPPFAPLQLPAVYNKRLSLLTQAIRVPVPNGTHSSDVEIPIDRLDEMFASFVVAIGCETGRPSYSNNAGTPRMMKDGMAAAYNENVTTNSVEPLSPRTVLGLLFLFLVSALILKMYLLGLFRSDVLVLGLLYGIAIWVLFVNTFTAY